MEEECCRGLRVATELLGTAAHAKNLNKNLKSRELRVKVAADKHETIHAMVIPDRMYSSIYNASALKTKCTPAAVHFARFLPSIHLTATYSSVIVYDYYVSRWEEETAAAAAATSSSQVLL